MACMMNILQPDLFWTLEYRTSTWIVTGNIHKRREKGFLFLLLIIDTFTQGIGLSQKGGSEKVQIRMT